MSANLDLLRSLYADWERGDFSRSDWVDPEIEFVVVEGPNAGTWHGLAGIAGAMREFLAAWKGYRVEAEEYRELDRDRVLVLTLDSGRGKQSGVAMEQRRAYVYLIRADKVSRITTYWDRDRALADLGLEEQAVSQEPTTPDLVEGSRRVNEAWNRGDFDAALATYTPDAVWDGSPMDGEVVEGRDAIRRFWEDWLAAYEEWENVAEELRDLGNGVGFGVYRQRARPAGSSGFVELQWATVAIVRGDGLTERLVLYGDVEEARTAAERLAEERG